MHLVPPYLDVCLSKHFSLQMSIRLSMCQCFNHKTEKEVDCSRTVNPYLWNFYSGVHSNFFEGIYNNQKLYRKV